MIVDHLSNLYKYTYLNSNINQAIEFMKTHDLLSLPQGKTLVDGNEVFLLRDTYQPRIESECFFEGHLKYLDIQIVLKGSEYIGYVNKKNEHITITHPYDAEKDIEKYQIMDYTKVHLYEKMFAIVFPDDLHMPKLRKEESGTVEKAVFKIRLIDNKE